MRARRPCSVCESRETLAGTARQCLISCASDRARPMHGSNRNPLAVCPQARLLPVLRQAQPDLRHSQAQLRAEHHRGAGRRGKPDLDDLGRQRPDVTYDNADRTTLVQNYKSDNSFISTFNYSYDHVGNKLQCIEADGDRTTYTYDDSYQLLIEQRSGANAYKNTFTYDQVGNRLRQYHNTGLTLSSFDNANRLQYDATSSGRTTYSYDAAGNQLMVEPATGARTTNTWDFENMNTQADLPTTVVTYTYRFDQTRMSKADPMEMTFFVWDQKNILNETNELFSVTVENTYEPVAYGNLESRRWSGETQFYHYNELGSTDSLTDPTQVITDQYTFDGWGNTVASSGTSPQPYRWVGRVGYYYDTDTGRHNLRRRDYESVIGRFLSEDPLGQAAGDPNQYRYVSNNPVDLADPSGEKSWACRQIDWLLGTSDACETFAALGNVQSLIISNLFSGTRTALMNFMAGAKQGFQSFLNNIGKHLKAALAGWLGIPVELFEFDLTNLTFANFVGAVLTLLGVTWDALANAAAAGLGPRFVKITIDILGELAAIQDQGLGAWAQSKVENFENMLSDLAGTVLKTAESFFDTAVEAVLAAGVRQAILWLISLLSPASAIGKLLLALYDLVKWILKNAAKIEQLLQTIIGAIQTAFSGSGLTSKIADYVENALGGMVLTLVTLLAALIGIGDLPDRVRSAIHSLSSAIPKLVTTLFKYVGDKLAGIYQAILSKFGLGKGSKAIVPPVEWGSSLWVNDKGIAYVKLDNKDEQTASSYINGLQNPCKKEAIAILKPLEDLAKATAGMATKPKQSKPNAKQLNPNARKIAKLQQQLASKLAECAATSATDRRACNSGLEVIGRSGMAERKVQIPGRAVIIYGTAQYTGSPGHFEASFNTATEKAKTTKYDYLTLNRSWHTSTGLKASDLRPDVIGVKCLGTVDGWGVPSCTDKPEELLKRLNEGELSLPASRQGEAELVDRTPGAKLEY